MERNIKAIFYDYKYYLLPEGVSLETLKEGGTFSLKRLKEERCMAPDFIYESIADEELVIEEPVRVFPVDVNLYTAAEYDEILRKCVDKVCPGCRNYEDDGDPSLDGHHREMGLDGVCYERVGKDDDWEYSTYLLAFWYRVSLKFNELASLIDAGNQKKLEKEVQKIGKPLGILPVKVYGGVSNGKYCLGFAPDYDHAIVVRTLVAFYAQAATRSSEVQEAGWEVFPCRKKGIYRYTGKTKMKTVRIRLVEEEGGAVSLQVLFRKALSQEKQQAVFQDVYDYICAELGEEVAFNMLYSVSGATDEAGREFLSVGEVVQKIAALHLQRDRDEAAEYPPSGYFNASADRVADLPFRSKITQIITTCPDASLMDERAALADAWWLSYVSFCYLYVPQPVDGAHEALGWYVANSDLVPEPLRNPKEERLTGCGIGLGVGEDCFTLDMLVASEQKYLRMLRTIAPVTMALGAKLVTLKEDGVMVYDLGYRFTPIEINGENYDE